MRFSGWLAFVVALIIAVFAIQNSTLPVFSVKLFAWQVETSPVYAILASLAAGVLIAVLLVIPYLIRESLRHRNLRREIETLRRPDSPPRTEARPAEIRNSGSEKDESHIHRNSVT